MKKPTKLTRDEYADMLKRAAVFRPASLYEPDHAPRNTKFFLVVLSPSLTRFMRLITPPRD